MNCCGKQKKECDLTRPSPSNVSLPLSILWRKSRSLEGLMARNSYQNFIEKLETKLYDIIVAAKAAIETGDSFAYTGPWRPRQQSLGTLFEWRAPELNEYQVPYVIQYNYYIPVYCTCSPVLIPRYLILQYTQATVPGTRSTTTGTSIHFVH